MVHHTQWSSYRLILFRFVAAVYSNYLIQVFTSLFKNKSLFYFQMLSLLQQWLEKAPEVQFDLPAPNMFIPRDFSIKTGQHQVIRNLFP